MPSLPTITIDLVLDRSTTKDVLRAMLHSILFHRLFGIVKPQTFEVLDVTMPGVSDPDVEQMVQEKVDLFWKSIENGGSKRGQILVTFSEKRPKKASWFGYGGEEEVPWEEWVINAEIRQPLDRDRLTFDSTLAATLTKSIQTMLMHTSSGRGRSVVPPITRTHNGISPFPFKLAVKMGGIEIG
ncbi:autophagy-related protein [Armillaria novae-zelandiae]|uniref:Autophagy-related protein 101 n=1 Tax=Armillaria novae-zelandiae TaxID=153914 RepID=A0AA39NYM3_9AGAR|nr:autophagy-related protein [Armillaria novae-zelandiae]